MPITSELISRFELYVDDSTELSSAEELALANKIYRKVLNYKDWEFLKKAFSATTTGVNYVALPTDFSHFASNGCYTDNSYQNVVTNSAAKVVWVGNSMYQLINWSDRRQYLNSGGYCYVDIAAMRLYFTSAPTSGLTVEADYIYRPADLTLSTSPVFPSDYHDVIYHGMASDDYAIQQFDKAKSYAGENAAKYEDYLSSIASWNSRLINY